jgi:hypothetical protein
VSRLEEALGNRALRDLASLAGGRSLRIPPLAGGARNAAARRRLVKLVGIKLAEDLITHFARTTIYVPNGRYDTRANPISRAQVMRLTRRGWSARRIAERLGCSDRTVYLKRAQARASRRKNP